MSAGVLALPKEVVETAAEQAVLINFRTPRALAMGFKPDADVESVIRDYVAAENIKI